MFRGHPDVVDADLADYFGSIPHADLLKSVARRIVDRRVLRLIKMWLECPVEETDQRGRTRRTTEARDRRRGIPQGSPLSPLLANLYMRRFVLGWKKLGLEQSLGTRLVTYADDLVILCRRGSAESALHHLREIMGKLKLTVNEEKTRICRVPDGEFDFLGYTFGRMYSPETGKARLGYRPSMGPFVGTVEIVCGTLIILGLFTRLAAIPLIAIMLVAITSTKLPIWAGHDIWIFHMPKIARYGFWSMAHEARDDFLLLLGSIYLLIAGAGAWSLDALLTRERSSLYRSGE